MASVGERLKQRMADLGIETLTDLSKRTNGKVSRSTLSQIAGSITATLRADKLLETADALDVNPKWLLYGTGPKIVSKTDDTRWTAQWTDAQRDLLSVVRLKAMLLTDDQCGAISQMIKSILSGGKVAA